jgi:hypothetical protein
MSKLNIREKGIEFLNDIGKCMIDLAKVVAGIAVIPPLFGSEYSNDARFKLSVIVSVVGMIGGIILKNLKK